MSFQQSKACRKSGDAVQFTAMPETTSFPADWWQVTPELKNTYPHAPWTWLLESGSLTQRLQKYCDQPFELRLLGEAQVHLGETEAVLLDSTPGAAAVAREVRLVSGGRPSIHAFSLLPLTTLEAGGAYLANLGGRPLGDALFSDTQLERGPIKVIMLEPGIPFYERVMSGTKGHGNVVWGRHSVFRTHGSPLLVCEFFLPEGCAGAD